MLLLYLEKCWAIAKFMHNRGYTTVDDLLTVAKYYEKCLAAQNLVIQLLFSL